jgi:hypothetical protein
VCGGGAVDAVFAGVSGVGEDFGDARGEEGGGVFGGGSGCGDWKEYVLMREREGVEVLEVESAVP